MRTITYFPLWIAVLFWAVWSTSRTTYEPSSIFWLSNKITLLEVLRGSLPVPQTSFQKTAVRIILNWIDGQIRETNRLAYNLTSLNG